MDKKLIVAVVRLRDAGKVVPRYTLAFSAPYRGVLTLADEHVPSLNRHSLVAILRDPDSGAPIDGLCPLVDARIVRATADEWVLTGFERVILNMDERDCAQSWVVRMESLVDALPQDGEGGT